MGARNRVGMWLSYRPARLHRLAELIPIDSLESILGHLKSLKITSLAASNEFISGFGDKFDAADCCSKPSDYVDFSRHMGIFRSCVIWPAWARKGISHHIFYSIWCRLRSTDAATILDIAQSLNAKCLGEPAICQPYKPARPFSVLVPH